MDARLNAAERRLSILAAARRVFAGRGFTGARMSDVAAAAGISEGLIYRSFPTKQDLAAALAEDHFREMGEQAVLEGELDEALRGLARGLIATNTAAPTAYRLFHHACLAADERLVAPAKRAAERVVQAVSARLAQAMEAGQLRRADPDRAALAFLGMVNQYLFLHVLCRSALCGAVPVDDYVDDVVDLFLVGLRTGGQPAPAVSLRDGSGAADA